MEAHDALTTQGALFPDARIERKEKTPSLTEKQIALALMRSRGIVAQAARLLDCSHTTIDKRLKKNQRLREVRESAREVLLDNSEALIADAIEAPCLYCGESIVTVAQEYEQCKARAAIPAGEDGPGNGRHVTASRCDPTERRNLAKWILGTLGRKRGFGEKLDIVKIPESLLENLSLEQIESTLQRLREGEQLSDILLNRA